MGQIVNAPSRSGHPARHPPLSAKVTRFLDGERFLHWALAIPYVLLYASAAALVLLWNEPPPRHFHTAAGWVHRGAGILLIVLPPLALFLWRGDWRMHLYNLRQGWIWDRNDLRWLLLFPKAALDHRVALPEQGKFNAAEKLNFMMVMTTYPLYIATGILVWLPGEGFVPWVAHAALAVLGLPLVAGHIYMATVNRDTRAGLEGMITGWVDREWAKHHYRRWYREQFELRGSLRSLPEQLAESRPEPATPTGAAAMRLPAWRPPGAGAEAGTNRDLASLLATPALVRCPTCHAVHEFESWQQLLRRSFQVEPLFCSSCEAPTLAHSAPGQSALAQAVLRHLELGRAELPLALPTALDGNGTALN